MKYLVKWTEEVDYSVEIEASSPEEAETKAFQVNLYGFGSRPVEAYEHESLVAQDSIEVKEVQA